MTLKNLECEFKNKIVETYIYILDSFRPIRPIWPWFDDLTQVWPLEVKKNHDIHRFEISKKFQIFWGRYHQNWLTRWRFRAIFRFSFILLQSATTWSPLLVCQSPETSDQELSVDVWLIRLTSLIMSQNKCNLLRFSVVFWGSAYANDHLRPKVWYENDRKNMESLFEHKH